MAQEADTKTVTFDGVDYTVAAVPLEDLDALEALEDGKYAAFAKAVLGAKQYATFRADHKKTADVFKLVDVLLGDVEETEDKE